MAREFGPTFPRRLLKSKSSEGHKNPMITITLPRIRDDEEVTAQFSNPEEIRVLRLLIEAYQARELSVRNDNLIDPEEIIRIGADIATHNLYSAIYRVNKGLRDTPWQVISLTKPHNPNKKNLPNGYTLRRKDNDGNDSKDIIADRTIPSEQDENSYPQPTESPKPAEPNLSPKAPESVWRNSKGNNIEKQAKSKSPERIIAINAASLILSSLSEGTLNDLNPDIPKFLSDVFNNMNNHLHLYSVIKFTDIFNESSPQRLKRFFRVVFPAIVEEGYNPQDSSDEISKDEKQIIELCKALSDKGYDEKRVNKETFDYFGIATHQEEQRIA